MKKSQAKEGKGREGNNTLYYLPPFLIINFRI